MWITPEFEDSGGGNEFSTNKKFKSSTSNVIDKHMPSCRSLWAEETKPICSIELAVHKKKIQEVKSWFNEHLNGVKGKKFLLLTGPPGSGKSATLYSLCKEYNLEVREWYNQEKTDFRLNQDYHRLPQSDQFSNFLSRASKYGILFSSKDNVKPKKSLILIQEFPQKFFMDPNELHTQIRKYNFRSSCPIVFIISDGNDSKNVLNKLFPQDFQDEISVTNISFNSVASSIMLNALSRIVKLKVNNDLLKTVPSKQYLQSIVDKSDGDIRCAINTLQFSIMEDQSSCSVKKKASTHLSFDGVGCKDTKLLIFRALGKILYCKRKPISEEQPCLPSCLKDENRIPLEENPEEVFENCSMSASSFSLFLHHNCTPFFKDMTAMSKAINYITDTDILLSHWDSDNSLESYAASLCTRGLMHNLPSGSKGQSFRALGRPSYFKCTAIASDRLIRAKQLCKTVNCSDQELMCNLLPMTSKISFANSSADKLIREIGLIYPSASPSVKLRTSSNEPIGVILNTSLQHEDLQNDEDLDEDFAIEDVDD